MTRFEGGLKVTLNQQRSLLTPLYQPHVQEKFTVPKPD